LERLLDIREEVDLPVEIKDIRDEINIVMSVFRSQQLIVEQMRTVEHNARDLLPNPTVEKLLRANVSDFEKLDTQAKTTQDKVGSQLLTWLCSSFLIVEHIDGLETESGKCMGGPRSSGIGIRSW
jgi:hypothetical protein